MPLFSQRKGITPLQKAIQREAVDEELRNRLWNALQVVIWDKWVQLDNFGFQADDAIQVEHLVRSIWLNYFKHPLDTIPEFKSTHARSAYQVLREYFFGAKWWELYDFVEFVLKDSGDQWSHDLRLLLNKFLEAENAAYRVVEDETVEITDHNEIEAIESAIDKGVLSTRTHLQRALELLSDRIQPDYRNSIKESISAVEATCQTLARNSKATLGDCLKLLNAKKPLHPAFEQAFHKLYGYTSDEGGIRHSLAEESEHPTFADAKFMLVACAAFTNYLWTMAAESEVKLKQS
jgi:hypothetical protein